MPPLPQNIDELPPPPTPEKAWSVGKKGRRGKRDGGGAGRVVKEASVDGNSKLVLPRSCF